MSDFAIINEQLLPQAQSILSSWLPNGKLQGREYVCGNIAGDAGKSLKVNTKTGKWSDFAADIQGNDLVSLYAKIHKINNGQAVKQLVKNYDLNLSNQTSSTTKPAAKKEPQPTSPPPGTRAPRCPSAVGKWEYKDIKGNTLFWTARYDNENGKSVIPYSWISGKWQSKALPAPRPLYGLELLKSKKPILLVEGEKCAEAGRKLIDKDYIVMCWPGGTGQVRQADLSPIKNRQVTLWPDADESGRKAMSYITTQLPSSVTIDIPKDKAKGWDIADALADGWDYQTTRQFINEHVRKSDLPASDDPAQGLYGAALWEQLGLSKTNTGTPHANLNNAAKCLEQLPHFKDNIWYDSFHDKVFTTLSNKKQVLNDAHEVEICRYLQNDVGIHGIKPAQVHSAIVSVSRKHARDEVKDYLISLKWDGIDRLAYLMHEGFSAKDTNYTRRIGECWIISMVARIFRPGAKVDTMPVFEGRQGARKSSALSVIGGDWYTSIEDMKLDKDFYINLQGAMVVEIAEMHSFGRADIRHVKGVITKQIDRYRAPYARNAQEHPRRFVFAGTTNEDDWVKDDTGARRFWPIHCEDDINLNWIKANRDHLFAEAVHRYKQGENWWVIPEEEAKMEQDARRQEDSWEEKISDWLIGQMGYVTTGEILEGAINLQTKEQDRRSQLRLTGIMAHLGWEKAVHRVNSKNTKVWRRQE